MWLPNNTLISPPSLDITFGNIEPFGWGDSVVEDFVSKNDEFCIKNEEFCIKNVELCIENDYSFRSLVW